jgi:hypothetical protein
MMAHNTFYYAFHYKFSLNWYFQACAHGTYSSEELKAQSRQYQEKLRLNRILQVCL